MDEATYCNFISAVAQERYFAVNGNRLLGASDLGYPESGSELLNALLRDMAEDVLEISSESAEVLQIGFAYGFHASGDVEGLSCNRVAIDENTAKCPMTNAVLRLITLEPAQRIHVRDTLIKMAREKSLEYTAKLKAKGRGPRDEAGKAEEATKMLAEFSERLDTREGKPFTAIVDGANVAYFGRSLRFCVSLCLSCALLELLLCTDTNKSELSPCRFWKGEFASTRARSERVARSRRAPSRRFPFEIYAKEFPPSLWSCASSRR